MVRSKVSLFFLLVVSGQLFAQNSPHGRLRYACTECHGTDSWKMSASASFNHGSTGFALSGKHGSAPCASCHGDLKFSSMNAQCSSCHTDVHRQELGPSCQRCHHTTSWKVADMKQRHQQTRFPLLGKHISAECARCHNLDRPQPYTSVSPECVSCHRVDYAQTQNPNHLAAGFSTDCAACHDITSSSWPGTFNHSLTGFPLTGAHTATPCLTCHVNANYRLQYVDCNQCHATDYNSTTNPNHQAALFSRDCTRCHTTMAWRPSTFNHDQVFRIYSGKHRGKWSQCSECHATPGPYQNFTCFSCHEHNQTAMNDKHQGVPGYVYSSPACYNCHRND